MRMKRLPTPVARSITHFFDLRSKALRGCRTGDIAVRFEIRVFDSLGNNMSNFAEALSPVIRTLIDYLLAQNPYLDANGEAYLDLRSQDNESSLLVRLHDYRVSDLLLFLFHQEQSKVVTTAQIRAAMGLVQGQLLTEWRKSNRPTEDPTLRLFLTVASEHEGWAGSAKELLDLLRETQRRRQVVRCTETLPDCPTALGMWLAKNVLRLQKHGIQIYRPTRRSEKRRWAWCRILKDIDTNDTSSTAPNSVVSSEMPDLPNASPADDGDDTSDGDRLAQLTEMLSDALS
jgi:hypothetical protein